MWPYFTVPLVVTKGMFDCILSIIHDLEQRFSCIVQINSTENIIYTLLPKKPTTLKMKNEIYSSNSVK